MLDDEFKRLNRLGGHAFVETNKRIFGAWRRARFGSGGASWGALQFWLVPLLRHVVWSAVLDLSLISRGEVRKKILMPEVPVGCQFDFLDICARCCFFYVC